MSCVITLERQKVITVRYGSRVRLPPPPLLSFLVFFPWLPPFLHDHSPLQLISNRLYSPCHSFLSPARHFLCKDAGLPPLSSSHTNFRFKPCASLFILIVRPIVWETWRGPPQPPPKKKFCIFYAAIWGENAEGKNPPLPCNINLPICQGVGLFLQLFIYLFIGIVIG